MLIVVTARNARWFKGPNGEARILHVRDLSTLFYEIGVSCIQIVVAETSSSRSSLMAEKFSFRVEVRIKGVGVCYSDKDIKDLSLGRLLPVTL